MEADLALYQLAAPCTSCQGMAAPNFDLILKRGNQILELGGSVAGFLQKLNIIPPNEKVTLVNPHTGQEKTMTAAEAQNLVNKVSNDNSGAGLEAIAKVLEKVLTNQTPPQTPTKDNTPLYIGIGVGGFILVMMMMMMMNKK